MHTIFYAPRGEQDPYLTSLRNEASAAGRACIVNAIAIRDDYRILILRRASSKSFLPNCWDLPGGHVEPSEPLQSALRREVREEIGVEISAVHALIAIWDWEKPDRSGFGAKSMRQFEFLVGLSGTKLFINHADFSEHRWIDRSELFVFMENRRPDDTEMLAVLRHAYDVKGRHP